MAGSFAPGRKSTTALKDADFWATSQKQFSDAQSLYGRPFRFDVCAEATTAKCGPVDYFSPERGDDALQLDWPADWWCNPPFSRKVEFIVHGLVQAAEGKPGMMLLPYEPLSQWWQDNLGRDVIVYEPDGRYNFVERDGVTMKTGVNFGTALVLFGGFMVGPSIRITYQRGIGEAWLTSRAIDELI